MKNLLHLWKAFDYIWQGVRNTFYDEIAFRIELAVVKNLNSCCTAIACLLIVSFILVFIIELLNTAVEAEVKKISTEQYTLSAKAMVSINLVVV